MCDEHTEADNESKLASGDLTRRGFGVMSAAALAACASTPAQPLTIVESEHEIATPDGVCDAHFAAPSAGKHPAVLVWPDIGGLRPAFRTMGVTLAQSGYAVLTVNPFYRSAKGLQFDASKETLQTAMARTRPMAGILGQPGNAEKDATAFIGWLDKQKSVNTSRGVGTTGYCMGGPLVMRTLASNPNRAKAGGSFHGGGLVTDAPTSPHLMVPQMKAKAVLIAEAQNDAARQPTVKPKLVETFAAANIPLEIETYAADHGWCVLDSTVFNKAEADRAWARLLATFEKGL